MSNDILQMLCGHETAIQAQIAFNSAIAKSLRRTRRSCLVSAIAIGYLCYRLYKAETRIEELESNRR